MNNKKNYILSMCFLKLIQHFSLCINLFQHLLASEESNLDHKKNYSESQESLGRTMFDEIEIYIDESIKKVDDYITYFSDTEQQIIKEDSGLIYEKTKNKIKEYINLFKDENLKVLNELKAILGKNKDKIKSFKNKEVTSLNGKKFKNCLMDLEKRLSTYRNRLNKILDGDSESTFIKHFSFIKKHPLLYQDFCEKSPDLLQKKLAIQSKLIDFCGNLILRIREFKIKLSLII